MIKQCLHSIKCEMKLIYQGHEYFLNLIYALCNFAIVCFIFRYYLLHSMRPDQIALLCIIMAVLANVFFNQSLISVKVYEGFTTAHLKYDLSTNIKQYGGLVFGTQLIVHLLWSFLTMILFTLVTMMIFGPVAVYHSFFGVDFPWLIIYHWIALMLYHSYLFQKYKKITIGGPDDRNRI